MILSLRIYIQISLEQWVVKSIEQHAICTYLTFHNFYVSDNDLKLTLFKVFQGLTYNDTLREMQLVCIADLIIIIFTFWCICLDVNVRLELNITLHRKKGLRGIAYRFQGETYFMGVWYEINLILNVIAVCCNSISCIELFTNLNFQLTWINHYMKLTHSK